MIDENQVFKHPSYILAGFTRWQGTRTRLFGSPLDVSQGISLTVYEGERHHHLNQDRYHSRKEIMRIDMTEMQFATLITSTGTGMGVPATLSFLQGIIIEQDKTGAPSEAELIHKEFKGKSKEINDKLVDSINNVNNIINNSKLSKKDKEDIHTQINILHNEIHSNLPFLLSQLHEAADRIVTHIKGECVAFAKGIGIIDKVVIGKDNNLMLGNDEK